MPPLRAARHRHQERFRRNRARAKKEPDSVLGGERSGQAVADPTDLRYRPLRGRVAQWTEPLASNQKVAGSIPAATATPLALVPQSFAEAARLEGDAALHARGPSANTCDLVHPTPPFTGHLSELEMSRAECFFAVPKAQNIATLEGDHGNVRPPAA